MLRRILVFTLLFSSLSATASDQALGSLFATLLGPKGEPAWKMLREVFPGKQPNEVFIPGQDLKNLGLDMGPNFDEYVQTVLEQIDDINVQKGNGKFLADITFTPESGYRLGLTGINVFKNVDVDSVVFQKKVHVEVTLINGSILIQPLTGVDVMIKTSYIEGSISPELIYVDINEELISVGASLLNTAVRFILQIDMKTRAAKGVRSKLYSCCKYTSFCTFFDF